MKNVVKDEEDFTMRTIFIYLFALLFSYGLHAQDITSLHDAVERQENAFEFTFELLKAGADVGVVNEEGETPLHLATKKRTRRRPVRPVNLPVIFLLIQYRADVHAVDKNGWTPFLRMASLNDRQYNDFIHFLEWWPTQVSGDSIPLTSEIAVDTPVDDALVNSNYYYSNDGDLYYWVSISDGFTTEWLTILR